MDFPLDKTQLIPIMKYRVTHKIEFPVEIFIYAFLFISILSIYWQVRTFDFISFDDYMYVRDNPHVRQGITLENIRWAFTSVYAGNWHPLTWLSHMTDVEIFGLNAGMHHLTNVIFHIVNTLMLFYCLRRMTGNVWNSAAVAMLFGLHPLHVESVAWIAERKDVLSAFFWMLTILFYTRYVEHRSAGRYLIIVICYIFGLMTKPMLVTLPFVLLLLDIWPLKRPELITTAEHMQPHEWWSGLLALIHEKVPLFFLAGAAIIVTILAQKNVGSISNLESIPLYIRVENATISYMAYLVKMIWPIHLALFYPYPRMVNLYKVITACVLLIGITWMVVLNISRFPFLFVGWFWYLGTLAPVIGIIQVGSQSMADRYTYVPLIGIFILIVWGLSKLLGQLRSARYILAGIYCAIVPVIMWFTWLQTGYWASNISVFSHAVDVTNDNYLAHNSLGVALCEHGEFDAGIKHYMEALRVYPEHVQAHNNLGAALVEEGKYKDSIGHFRKALQIDPGFVSAHYNLGIAYYAIGKLDEAIKQYQEVLRLVPQYPEASLKMATAITKQRKINDAIARLNDALKINPQDYTILCKVAELYNDEGNTKEAINHYESALSVNPGLTRILQVLVILYAENGEYDKSLLLLHRMAKLNPDDPDVYYNIACIYSRQGRVDSAVMWLSEAIKKGFKNKNILRTDPDLVNVRETEFYKKLLMKSEQ